MPWLRAHLGPRTRRDKEQLQRLIADLDADEYRVREEATRALHQRGKEVEGALRRALQTGPSPEMRRRLQDLLRDMPPTVAEPVRTGRALEVLRWLNTTESRRLLSDLSGSLDGPPGAW